MSYFSIISHITLYNGLQSANRTLSVVKLRFEGHFATKVEKSAELLKFFHFNLTQIFLFYFQFETKLQLFYNELSKTRIFIRTFFGGLIMNLYLCPKLHTIFIYIYN